MKIEQPYGKYNIVPTLSKKKPLIKKPKFSDNLTLDKLSFRFFLFFLPFLGLVQIIAQYLGLPLNNFNTIYDPISNTNIYNTTWKTFYVSEYKRILKPSKAKNYKKINCYDQVAFIKLKSRYQNQHNSLYCTLIPFSVNKFDTNYYSYYFSGNRKFPFYLFSNYSLKFDQIPSKMESNLKIKRKRRVKPLLKKKLKYNDILEKTSKPKKPFSLSKKPFSLQFLLIQRKLNPKLKLITSEHYKRYELLIRKYKTNIKNRKPVLKKTNDLLETFKERVYLRKALFKYYREAFFNQNDKLLNFKKVRFREYKKFKKLRKSNLILKKLINKKLNYSKIFNIFNKLEFSYLNSNLRPRIYSGYRFPDHLNFKRKNSPEILKVYMTGAQRNFFIKKFYKSLKHTSKRNNVLYIHDKQKSTHLNFQKFTTVYNNENLPESKQKSNKLTEFYFKQLPKIPIIFEPIEFVYSSESLNPHSWLVITKLGVVYLGFYILRDIFLGYGREIAVSIFDIMAILGLIGDDPEFLKEELGLGPKNKGYRAVRKVERSFKEIAGLIPLMMELGDQILVLKAKRGPFGNLFKFYDKPNIVTEISFQFRPVLLVGAPGTGKTFIVQAIAGETNAPVVLQSGSIIKDHRERGKGARAIMNLFRRARRAAPCIVFIDEMDEIGLRRSGLSLNPYGGPDIIESIDGDQAPIVTMDDVQKILPKARVQTTLKQDLEKIRDDKTRHYLETISQFKQRISKQVRLKEMKKRQIEVRKRAEQLAALAQLLSELDGVDPLGNIMVFGATNRPHVLDPALLRAGRFHKVITMTLPGYKKRIEILKLYTSRLKSSAAAIRYFAKRTEGFSAADVAAIANQSTLVAICENEPISMRIFDEGFDRVMTYDANRAANKLVLRKLKKLCRFVIRKWCINSFFNENFQLKALNKPVQFSSGFNIKNSLIMLGLRNLTYYKAGQALVETILPKHPSSQYFDIRGREKHFRSFQRNTLLLTLMERLMDRVRVESRLTGLISGKAAEYFSVYSSILAHFSTSNLDTDITTTGYEDLKVATVLAVLMVEKWYYYADSICTRLTHPIIKNRKNFAYSSFELRVLKAMTKEMFQRFDFENLLKKITDPKSTDYWWPEELIEEVEYFDKEFRDWYRIFLHEPEETARNLEWVPPEKYYTDFNIQALYAILYWRDYIRLSSDYLYHSLLISCFNLSYSILTNNRELIDHIVDFTFRYRQVRENHITALSKSFIKKKTKSSARKLDFENFIVREGWGKFSRRRNPRSINIIKINEELEKQEEEMIRKAEEKAKEEAKDKKGTKKKKKKRVNKLLEFLIKIKLPTRFLTY